MRAAARVFRWRGFAAAGMRDIGTAADLSPGNLYHYFRGKDELLFFCQDRAADRLLAALGAGRRGRPPPRAPRRAAPAPPRSPAAAGARPRPGDRARALPGRRSRRIGRTPRG